MQVLLIGSESVMCHTLKKVVESLKEQEKTGMLKSNETDAIREQHRCFNFELLADYLDESLVEKVYDSVDGHGPFIVSVAELFPEYPYLQDEGLRQKYKEYSRESGWDVSYVNTTTTSWATGQKCGCINVVFTKV